MSVQNIGRPAEGAPCAGYDEAPASTTPPRPGYCETLICASYRAAHLAAPAALVLLLLAAVLVAGGAA